MDIQNEEQCWLENSIFFSFQGPIFQKPRAVMLEGSFGFTRRTGNPGMQVEPIELFEMWGDVRIQFHITIGMISHRIHVSFHEIFFKNVGLDFFEAVVDLECWLGKVVPYGNFPPMGLPTFHPSPVHRSSFSKSRPAAASAAAARSMGPGARWVLEVN